MKFKIFLFLLLSLLLIGASPRKIKILMAGDSTMAEKPLVKKKKGRQITDDRQTVCKNVEGN